MLIQLLSAILWRADGWGRYDSFLPFFPFNKLKCGGINYSRYAIGFVIAWFTRNPWYILTYAIAVSIPYGEGSWIPEKVRWLICGFMFGIASLSWGNAIFCSLLFFFLMCLSNEGIVSCHNEWYLDHSLVEFCFGGLGTMIFLFK